MIGDLIQLSPIEISYEIMYYEGRPSGDLYLVKKAVYLVKKKQYNYCSPIVITLSIMLLKGDLVAIYTWMNHTT